MKGEGKRKIEDEGVLDEVEEEEEEKRVYKGKGGRRGLMRLIGYID